MGAVTDRQVAYELLEALTHLRRVLRHGFYDRASVEPLSGSQGELLAVVAGHPGVTVNLAAASLHLAPNTVSALVSQLVRLGFLCRDADRDDARLTRLELTEAGRARRSARRDHRRQAVTAALGGLGPDERTAIAAALPALRALVAAIEAGGECDRSESRAGADSDAARACGRTVRR
jgi:DNA-binding MarR family transcriptional regulator